VNETMTPSEFNDKTSQVLEAFCRAFGPNSYGWCGAGYDENDRPKLAYFLFETPKGMGVLILGRDYFTLLADGMPVDEVRQAISPQIRWELSVHGLFSYFQTEEFYALLEDASGQEQLSLVCEVAKNLSSPRVPPGARAPRPPQKPGQETAPQFLA
jgi:hypothetical protein